MPDIRAEIRGQGLRLGFDVVRFAAPQASPDAVAGLTSFLARGHHGTMAWMDKNAGRRADPTALWPDTRAIVVLGMNYAPKRDPRELLLQPDRATISCHAQGDDYHDVIKAKLKILGQFIADRFDAGVRVFVDTAPVMEKPLAQSAGGGWPGKHTNLVSRTYGSWLFLGSIFTTLEIAPDDPEHDHCGACTRCLDICPTAAFTAPYEIDARRCISYLTIEYKGHIPVEFRALMGNRIYGCDDCLAVCPWNKFASVAREVRFHARSELAQPVLADLAQLSDADFRTLFRGSPIKRIGRDRFVRNVLIAIGNSGDRSSAPVAQALLDDSSPLVRAMAVWALSRLLESSELSVLAANHASAETNSDVRKEWTAAIST